ncbi:MAG: type II toxin-antitoxin system HicA family toxin [Chloroflexota bacterium]
MTKLPIVNGPDCIRALQKAGFIVSRQSGSHVILKRPPLRVTVPNHRKPIKAGTLHQIIKDAGLTVDAFIALL